jgi:hypothetical protein
MTIPTTSAEWTWRGAEPEGDGDEVSVSVDEGGILWSRCAAGERQVVAFQSFAEHRRDGAPAQLTPIPDHVRAALAARAAAMTVGYADLAIRVVARPPDAALDLMFIHLDGIALAELHCESRPRLPLEIAAACVAPGGHRLEVVVEVAGRRLRGDFAIQVAPARAARVLLTVTPDGVALS